MRALVYHDTGDIRCENVPDPSPEGKDGAVVRIERCMGLGPDRTRISCSRGESG